MLGFHGISELPISTLNLNLPVEETTGLGKYTYVPTWQSRRLDELKTDLYRVDNVIQVTEAKKQQAAASALQATKKNRLKRAEELRDLEIEFQDEINRLLLIRMKILMNIRREEEFLGITMMSRRKLRKHLLN